MEYLLAKLSIHHDSVKEDYMTSIKYKFKNKKDIYFVGNEFDNNLFFLQVKKNSLQKFNLGKSPSLFLLLQDLLEEKGILELYEAVNQLLKD